MRNFRSKLAKVSVTYTVCSKYVCKCNVAGIARFSAFIRNGQPTLPVGAFARSYLTKYVRCACVHLRAPTRGRVHVQLLRRSEINNGARIYAVCARSHRETSHRPVLPAERGETQPHNVCFRSSMRYAWILIIPFYRCRLLEIFRVKFFSWKMIAHTLDDNSL